MRAAASTALFVAAAGFVAAQDDVVLTTTVVVPEATSTVWVPVSDASDEAATASVTLSVSWDTVTVSEGIETATEWYEPEPEDTDTVTLIPVATSSWVRYWPEVSSLSTVTTTFYTSVPPNATGIEQPHPTAAAGRTSAGSSLVALVGFAVASVLLL